MFARSKFSAEGKVGQDLDQDEVLDRFKAALMQDGEVFEFSPATDGSCRVKAAPNKNMYGIKAKMTPRFDGGTAYVSVEGRWQLSRSFWWFIHMLCSLLFLPYLLFALHRASRSQRLALSYGEDLIRRMRAMN